MAASIDRHFVRARAATVRRPRRVKIDALAGKSSFTSGRNQDTFSALVHDARKKRQEYKCEPLYVVGGAADDESGCSREV